MKTPVRKRRGESGQAALLVILAMGIFLLGAVGLAVDGSNLYAQRQMAQAAADAAAQAGIMSIFDGTDTVGSAHYFLSATGTHSCGSSDQGTPCYYAQTLNGFNGTGDTVTYEPNPPISVPNLTAGINMLRVTVQRSVPTTLIRMLGPTASTIKATGTAAIVDVMSPVPIVITHPTMAGALNMNGTTNIKIIGGPQKSIQVNSSGTNPAGAAYSGPSSGSVDLSLAGPQGTGADFGTFGGPINNPGNVNLGSAGTGHYFGHASPIQDPLAGVLAPSPPTAIPPVNGQACSILGHCGDCPAPGFTGAAPATCTEYLPGKYSALDLTGVNSAIFDPGVYYIQGGGFTLKNDTVAMCNSCAADAITLNGMVVYDTGANAGSQATGGFTIDTNANVELKGAGITTLAAAPAAPYYGILFFEDRNANPHVGNGAHGAHQLGAGNGCFSIIGTIYITNTLAIMDPRLGGNVNNYQSVIYHGTPCTGVQNYGEIIVSQLTVKGTSGINMKLFPTAYLKIRQVALVQ